MADLGSAFDWHQPVQIAFGAGCVERLPEALGSRRAIVVAFPMAGELGIEGRLSRALGDRLVQWIPCPDDIASLGNALRLCRQVWPTLDAHPDAVLIGIGGGTVLDLAKVARCRPVASDGDSIAAALRGLAPWPQLQPATLWLVPTTAGTGSEVTRWATVWDTDAHPHAKLSLDEPFGYAQRAWIDPLLTLSCPPKVTRESGIDALGHALESIWNRHANAVSDAIALAAAKTIVHALPLVLNRPDDAQVRAQVSLAALQAGIAFSQTRTALAHALSYQLTLEQGLAHGAAVAAWLPMTWSLATGHSKSVDRILGAVFGGTARAGAPRLRAWLLRAGAPGDPSDVDVHDAQQRVKMALSSARGRNFIAASSSPLFE